MLGHSKSQRTNHHDQQHPGKQPGRRGGRRPEQEAFLALKAFMYDTVYIDRTAKQEERKVRTRLIGELYRILFEATPEQMSNFYLQLVYQEGRSGYDRLHQRNER